MRHIGVLIYFLPWILIVVIGTWVYARPDSSWIDYKGVYIEDGVEGGPSPSVTLTKEINDAFIAHWNHVIYKTISPGRVARVCEAQGELQESPDILPPTDADLAWLMDDNPACKLSAGEYDVQTILSWDNFGQRRNLVIDSNLFQIHHARGARGVQPAPPIPSPIRYRRRPHGPSWPWPFSLLPTLGLFIHRK